MQIQPLNLMERRLPAPRNGGFRMDGYWVWCGSVVRGEDGNYHMFASRWPKGYPMHPGWLVKSEVVRAVSPTPEGPYTFQEVVLPARGPQFWDGRMTHNPHITKYQDTYILYYTGSTHPFEEPRPDQPLSMESPYTIVARANKRVGIAVSKSVFGPWERLDAPILPTRPGHFDDLLTSNPSPCILEDGSVLLVYKARAYKKPPYEGLLHGPMTLGAARAGHYRGPYQVCKDETLFPSVKAEVEDPFIWKASGGFEMIAKDMTGELSGERHGGIHAWSENGTDWKINLGEQAYSRRILWDDGQTQLMGSMERPFLLFDESGKPTHMFCATSNGTKGFSDATDTWNMAIPLK